MAISSCPACDIAMEVQNFEDVLIDVCPSCRGVWLDRGEMHKIIAHVRRQEAETPSHDFNDTSRTSYSQRDYNAVPNESTPGHGKRRRKRGLWDMLEEIID